MENRYDEILNMMSEPLLEEAEWQLGRYKKLKRFLLSRKESNLEPDAFLLKGFLETLAVSFDTYIYTIIKMEERGKLTLEEAEFINSIAKEIGYTTENDDCIELGFEEESEELIAFIKTLANMIDADKSLLADFNTDSTDKYELLYFLFDRAVFLSDRILSDEI